MKRLLPIIVAAPLLLVGIAHAQMFRTYNYGAGWGADSLANIEVGKVAGRKVSYRFVCDHTGLVTQAQFFLIFKPGGYFGGDGGTILVQLEADNGSGQPSGVALSSYSITDPLTANCGNGCTTANYRTVTLSPASVSLTSGSTYHLVFTDTAADPVTNFTSLDDILTPDVGTDLWPMVYDSTYAMMFSNSGSLVVTSRHAPNLNIIYDDGYRQGNAYIDVIAPTTVTANGDISKIEQVFTTGSAAFWATRATVRFAPDTDGTATVALYDATPTLLASGTITFAASSSQQWYSISFPVLPLAAASTYSLVITPTAGSFTPRLLEHGDAFSFAAEGFTQHCSKWNGSAWVACYSNAATNLEWYLSSTTQFSATGSLTAH